jgi:hypothetical protein
VHENVGQFVGGVDREFAQEEVVDDRLTCSSIRSIMPKNGNRPY